jgi:hypothetical protein
MKKLHTLKYISKIVLFLICVTTQAQEKAKDSIAPKVTNYGLRVGIDLSKLARTFYEKDYKGLELVGDFRIKKNYYLAAELGNENKTVSENYLNFTTKGTYLKAGFDYNAYENWVGMNNMIYLGMRYGVSSFSQTLNSYTIYNTEHYYPAETNQTAIKFNGLSAQWLEVVAGIKVETIKNLYIGASVRLNYLVTQKQPENFENLYIPGFNKTYSGKFGAGFNYTLSYFIPIFKKQEKPKDVK